MSIRYQALAKLNKYCSCYPLSQTLNLKIRSTGDWYLCPNIHMTLTYIARARLKIDWVKSAHTLRKTIDNKEGHWKNWKTNRTTQRISKAHFMFTSKKNNSFQFEVVVAMMVVDIFWSIYTMFQFTKQQLWAHWLFVIPFGFKFGIACASVMSAGLSKSIPKHFSQYVIVLFNTHVKMYLKRI